MHAHTFSAKKEGLENISTLVDFNMPGAKEHATGKKVSGVINAESPCGE